MEKKDDEAIRWLQSSNLLVDTLYGICILFGIVTNPLTLFVCIRSNLRKTPTFIFISFGAVANLVSLLGSPLTYSLEQFVLGYSLRDESIVWCKMKFFLTFYSLHCNVWFMVFSIVEIYLTVRYVKFRPTYSNSRYAVVASLCAAFILLLCNSPKLLMQGYVANHNGTDRVVCFKSLINNKLFEIVGTTINALVYSIFPSIIIFTTNILLIYELRKSRSRCVKLAATPATGTSVSITIRSNNRRMATTQLILASLFLSVTLPKSISVFLYIVHRTQVVFFFAKLFDLITSLYFNSTILILLINNKPFRNEFKTLIFDSESRRSSSL